MGYTTAGGPKGLGQFNNTPQTTADLNKGLDLLAERGNYLGSVTEAERDLISGTALYEGLLIFNSTSNRIEMYDGSGWGPPSSGTAYAMAAGIVTPAAGFQVVTFPVGRFSQAPIITAQVASGSSGAIGATIRITAPTTTQFQIACTATGVPIHWHAVQMTPTSAAG